MKIFHYDLEAINQPDLQSIWATYPESANIDIASSDQPLTVDTVNLAHDADIITVFVGSRVTAEVIAALPQVKLIITRSTGYDHIDLATATARNITVCNIPGYGSRAVAEFAFALMLGLGRHIVTGSKALKSHQPIHLSAFEGLMLQGKTLGVVGTGRIGQEVIGIAKGFGMTVLGHDAKPQAGLDTKLGFESVELADLLSRSDVITIHVPNLPSTKHLINHDTIKHIKPGAILINTARGEIVDTSALISALDQNILAGAAVDVIEDEPDMKDEEHLVQDEAQSSAERMRVVLENHILMQRPNVIITPHIAFLTTESKGEIFRGTVDNIIAFLSGQPQNVIHLS